MRYLYIYIVILLPIYFIVYHPFNNGQNRQYFGNKFVTFDRLVRFIRHCFVNVIFIS